MHASGLSERSLHPGTKVSVARSFSGVARERASGRRERRRIKPGMILKIELLISVLSETQSEYPKNTVEAWKSNAVMGKWIYMYLIDGLIQN